uniref:Rho-GAP domain-containing protein n=1 Tax=Setaria digitata TaxID=48799 RepID=A0A915PVT2_9BILA
MLIAVGSKIRSQLNEQLRCLETRTEAQTAILLELNDYYRKKAELDGEYGKQLEKLAKNIMQKHKNERYKRDSWALHSVCGLWQHLVDQTKEEAKQKMALADLYAARLTVLIAQRADDLQRISRKCREIGSLAHGEICRVLNELHTAMRTYQLCFLECSVVETKFRQVEENKAKYEENNPTKLGVTRKHRCLAKLYNKRLEKYSAVKQKCLKARNEYLLCVQAANAALHKYFADDLSDLIDCMDLGMDQWLRGLINCTVSTRKDICQKEMDALAELCGFKESLDSKADKQRFIEANHATFMLPKRFEFRGQPGDTVSVVSANDVVAEELQQRHLQIERRLANVRIESEEIWKTLESTEKAVAERFMEAMTSSVITTEITSDTSREDYNDTNVCNFKNRINTNELYDFYLGKFSHYMLNSNLIERLEARANGIASALSGYSSKNFDGSTSSAVAPSLNSFCQEGDDAETFPSSRARTKKRIGSGLICDGIRRPKLFGGSLDEYVEATGEAIPLIITSTIRVLSQFALHHQGIFRISGSQIEINVFRESFEKGEDPLQHVVDATDVNSIAGVLKLYLRELRESLFPIFLFDQLTECARCSSADEFVKQVVPLIQKLSQPTQLVLRYLFAFLNHLSEFSDENMMDPYNLAICFGPTLLPIPDGKDQVFYHNFVNELVKNLIVYHDQIFSAVLPGPRYEKYLVESEQALFIDEQESAISGDEEAVTTPVFDYTSEKTLPGFSTPTMAFSWNAGDSAVEMLPAPSGAVIRTLHNLPETTVASDDQIHVISDHGDSSHSASGHRIDDTRLTAKLTPGPNSDVIKFFDIDSNTTRTNADNSSSMNNNEFLSNQKRKQQQIWSRRGCGVSSLREQLHHSRAHQQALTCDKLSPSSASLDALILDNRFDGMLFGSKVLSANSETLSKKTVSPPFPKEHASLSTNRFPNVLPPTRHKEKVFHEKLRIVEPGLMRSLPYDMIVVQSEQTAGNM